MPKAKQSYKTFTFDAGAVVALGRDSIKDNTTAIVELVKNSYDADSRVVLVQIVTEGESFIRISDVGTGMSDKEIDENWLRIGYSEKKEKKRTQKNRRKTGEKGIGRLSAYRLGNGLKITTRSEQDDLVSLYINWKDFEQSRVDAEKIKIRLLEGQELIGPGLEVNQGSGTEVFITGLRQHWMQEDVEDLYRELENLVPPFSCASNAFKIELKTDVYPKLNGLIGTPESKVARVELEAEYDGKGVITYKLYEPKEVKGKTKQDLVDQGKLKREQLIAVEDQEELWDSSVGPFSVTLRFYPQTSEYLNLIDINGAALRKFLEMNSGLKIYRDGIRVKPYGDPLHPDGDWLALEHRRSQNPAGAGRPSWKIANRQLVGGIFISRDSNAGLLDSSSREGLLNGDEFHELRSLMYGCISLLESHYHKSFVAASRKSKSSDKPTQDLKESVQGISRQVADISSSVKALVKDAPELSDEIQEIVERTALIQETVKEAQKDVEQLASQATTYRGLATIGITTAVFGHETQSAIDQLMASITAAGILLPKSGELDQVKEELIKAAGASKNVSAWGRFALSRVNRDKRRRRKISVNKLVGQIASEMQPLLNASDIETKVSLSEVEGTYFAMDIESIVMNLLSNAYFACKQKSKNRRVAISLVSKKVSGRSVPVLVVSDSGPGIPKVSLIS